MRWEVAVFMLCAAACVVGHVAILRSVVRSRTAAAAPAEGTVPRPRLGTEVLWALIPALALAVLLTFTWAAVRERQHAQPGVMLRVAQ